MDVSKGRLKSFDLIVYLIQEDFYSLLEKIYLLKQMI